MGSFVLRSVWAAKAPSARITLGWRAALQDIADIAVALAVEAHRLEHLREELPGQADEGLALRVLVGARRLADAHELGPRVAGAEDDRRAPLGELAPRAPLEALLLAGERLVRGGEIVAGERQILQAHGLVEAEGFGEGAAGLGRVLRRHYPRRGAPPPFRFLPPQLARAKPALGPQDTSVRPVRVWRRA